MKIPLTSYGSPQVILYPLVLIIVMILVATLGQTLLTLIPLVALEVVLGLILAWSLSFFRDPVRTIPNEAGLLVAPADGRITDIETLEQHEDFNGPVLRIGIFLSIFNVHINRAPCRARVEATVYRPGLYRNALNPESSRVNESNTIHLVQLDAPEDFIAVRQISGAIARHIVCRLKPDDILERGQAFGMIKFGSRTELYVPARESLECQIAIGDKVKAGETILARYQS